MPDQNLDKPKTEPKPESQTPPAAEPKKPEDQEHMIPKSRLDEVLQKNKELEERIAAADKVNKEAEEQRLADQEKWRELAEKRQEEIEGLKPKASVAEEQEKSLKAYLDAQIEEIPEDMRSLIPEQLTTLQKLDWLAKNRSLLIKPLGPDIAAGQQGAGGGKVAGEITPTMRKGAETFGLSEEQLKRAVERRAKKEK